MASDCEYAVKMDKIIEYCGAVFLLMVAVSTAFGIGYMLLRVVGWVL